ncbi:MAG: STT3 domain-containing protein [Candidatus Nanoarchaeia archaeon]|nr:STT3 domain-containing protein [Candidatus Nanoarchaeia archaeon]
MSEELQKRKEKLIKFLRSNTNSLSYILLTVIIWVSAWIRTLNIPLLNGKYIPDVDSYYFLRLAKYIAEHGALFTIDTMRNYPLGVDVSKDLIALPYVVAYIHKIGSWFLGSFTIEGAAIYYPVIFFILGCIFFFLLMRKIFEVKTALLSTAFLATVPAFLYRTTAGVTDKEPLGIFLMVLTFYLYIKAVYSKTRNKRVIYGLASGLVTGLLGLTWGGVQFVIGTMAVFHLLEIVINKFGKERYQTYLPWWLMMFFILTQATNRYGNLSLFFTSALFGSTTLVLVLAITNSLLQSERWNFTKKIKEKYPTNILSLVIGSLSLILFSSILFGTSFITNQAGAVYRRLTGQGFSRWLLTVAENRQTFFVEWYGQLGGKLFTWLFLIGAVVLFYHAFKKVERYKWQLTGFFAVFLAGFTLNRYSGSSIFNGTSGLSLLTFFGSIIMFAIVLVYYYTKAFYKDKETLKQFQEVNSGYLFIIVWFLMNIIAAKLGIRFLFVLGPTSSIAVAFLLVTAYDSSFKFKKQFLKIAVWAVLIVILYLTIVKFTISDYNMARWTGPSYHTQWQQGMDWVRENTPEDSVFAHWWDYGYWVQQGGERATILDGGNFIVWWNHLMGRHVLTGHSSDEALKFLKTHDASHLLIVSDEIGKYGAYSSIASDKNFDRLSIVPVGTVDYSQTQETRNETYYVYRVGMGLDENFYYQGQLLPRGTAAIGGVLVPIKSMNNIEGKVAVEFGQPRIAVVYNGQQYNIPLGCIWYDGVKYEFPEKDYNGCLRIMPVINNNQIDVIGGSIFLTEKVAKTLFAQMYIMDQEWAGFKLVYSDASSVPLAVYQGRLIGPMKIWEIDYPARLQNYENPDYLATEYLDKELI